MAFEALVERHGERVYYFIYRRLGHIEDAQDVTQQVFIAAWRGLQRYDPLRAFKPWLFTVARRLAASHYRRRRVSLELSVEEEDHRDPATILGEKEQAEALWSWARALLSTQQFTAFWLRTEETFSIGDIARIMGKSETHVKVMLFRARQRLAGALTALRHAEPTRKEEDHSQQHKKEEADHEMHVCALAPVR